MTGAPPADLNWDVIDDVDLQSSQKPASAGFGRELRVLLVCNYDPRNAATMCDHVNAFLRYSRNRIYVLSRTGDLFQNVSLENFDVVVIHYSLALALDSYVSPQSRYRLQRFAGLKALFIQDEYRFVDATIETIATCGVSLVFTCLPPQEVPKVYGDPRMGEVRFVQVLTGYVPEWLKIYEPLPLRSRRVMVGYRGRTYPAWHGEAGREKVEIGKRFRRDAARYRLRTDIAWSEERRLYGRAWLDFIRRCRAVLAVESGASVFDYDGTVSARTESFAALARRPGLLKGMDRKVPYEVLRERFFAGREDQVDLAQVSPRVFEAIALRTLIIAYPGRYSGVMQPWRHYIPLQKDQGNMGEVVAALRDVDRVSEMIANAFAEVAMNPALAYPRLISQVDTVFAEMIGAAERSTAYYYDPAAFHLSFGFEMIANPHDPGGDRARRLVGGIRRLTDQAYRLATGTAHQDEADETVRKDRDHFDRADARNHPRGRRQR